MNISFHDRADTMEDNTVMLASKIIDGNFVGIGGLFHHGFCNLELSIGPGKWQENVGEATGTIGLKGLCWIARQLPDIIAWLKWIGIDEVCADGFNDRLKSAYRYLIRFGFKYCEGSYHLIF